jgi:hypothetical protein
LVFLTVKIFLKIKYFVNVFSYGEEQAVEREALDTIVALLFCSQPCHPTLKCKTSLL